MTYFRMPDSWYDPPEYSFQRQAEEVFERGLFGLYERDPETGKTIRPHAIPDDYGTEEEMNRLYESIIADEPEAANVYFVDNLSFEACCDIAESEYDSYEPDYDDRDDRDYYEDGPDY